MPKMILRLPTRRKQLQKSVVSRQWRHIWLLLMSLSLLAACSTPFSTPSTAQSTTSATQTTTTKTTGNIAAVIDCSSLAKKDFSTALSGATVKITSATVVAASGSTPQSCKLDGTISPQIKFEVQLPTKQWNGDYFEGGCGGLCGMVSESADCQSAFTTGSVVAYNDMGHESAMGSNTDMTWALNETQRQDFAYLANHDVAVLGKVLIKTYYGRSVSYSYFDGCSDGGREALVEAQRYPTEFNGIIAGAPAMYFSFLNTFQHAWVAQNDLDSSGKEILTSNALTVLHNAVMAACDKLDGSVNGLIGDPFACTFDPTTIECTATKTTNCLTAQQAEIAKKIYAGPVDEKGEHLYPGGGYAYGSESGWSGSGTMGQGVADSVLGYLSQPGSTTKSSTDALNLKFTSTQFKSFLKAAEQYDATNADLSAFRAHGGKLMLWHGMSDWSIPTYGTVAYYQAMIKQMGSLSATQQFARLFLFPGVYHCGDGYGPSHFDLVTPITNWVEHGVAPSTIIATRYSSDDTQSSQGGAPQSGGVPSSGTPSGTPSGSQGMPTGGGSNQTSGTVVRTLPVYPYPQIPRYSGSGSTNTASSYSPVTSTDIQHHSFSWVGEYLFGSAPSKG